MHPWEFFGIPIPFFYQQTAALRAQVLESQFINIRDGKIAFLGAARRRRCMDRQIGIRIGGGRQRQDGIGQVFARMRGGEIRAFEALDAGNPVPLFRLIVGDHKDEVYAALEDENGRVPIDAVTVERSLMLIGPLWENGRMRPCLT